MSSATASLAEGWPALSVRQSAQPQVSGPAEGAGPLAGPRWFMVWNRDGLGECCCWRGTVRRQEGGAAYAAAGNCQRPGKHPWVVRAEGEPIGFVHGAADALEYGELIETYGETGGARQLAVVLDDLLVVDLDTPRAVRDFARMRLTIPAQKILGISSSPRGFHVWLDCPGWNQKALNRAMADWLGKQGFAWSGTDAGVAGMRGLLVDVRTGSNRYMVWPGAQEDRRWLDKSEFWNRLTYELVGMPAWRMVGDSAGAPWSVDTSDAWVAGWIAEQGGGTDIDLSGLEFDGSDTELEFTWSELERWIRRLEGMAPGEGRNSMLNIIAYHSGARCVAAGHPEDVVRARLVEAGEGAGTHGVVATVNSGLTAGLRALWTARTAAVQSAV